MILNITLFSERFIPFSHTFQFKKDTILKEFYKLVMGINTEYA